MPWLKCVVNSCVSTDNKGIKDCGQKIPVCLDPGTNGNCQVIGARGGERRCSRKAEVVILYQMVLHALFLLCCCFCSQDTHRLYGKRGSVTHQPALVCVRAVHCVSARVCTLLLEPGPTAGSCGLCPCATAPAAPLGSAPDPLSQVVSLLRRCHSSG